MSSPAASGVGDASAKKPLEQITFRFCSECSNMLYPKEDENERKLLFTCRTCNYSTDATSTCIYRNILNNKAGETAGVTQDVGSDPTVGHPHVLVFDFPKGFHVTLKTVPAHLEPRVEVAGPAIAPGAMGLPSYLMADISPDDLFSPDLGLIDWMDDMEPYDWEEDPSSNEEEEDDEEEEEEDEEEDDDDEEDEYEDEDEEEDDDDEEDEEEDDDDEEDEYEDEDEDSRPRKRIKLSGWWTETSN